MFNHKILKPMKKQIIMNKNTLTLVPGLIMMITLSCEKEKKLQTFSTKGENSIALRLTPDELVRHTNSFITQSLSGEWNLGNYKFQDAVLILEGALNYRTCTPHEYYDEIATDSASFSLSIFRNESDEWVADAERIITLWNRLLTHSREVRVRLGNESYFNIVADLEITRVNYETENIEISVVIWVGQNKYTLHPCDFSTTDYWYAGTLGPCSIGSGSVLLGSWDIIEMKLNPFACFGQPRCDYYSDISWKTFNPYNQQGPILVCGTGCNSLNHIWMGNWLNQCLSPAELKCERDAIRSLSLCNKPLVTGSLTEYKHPISYDVNVDPYYTNNWWAFHGAKVYYGKCNSYTPD
jgi:hypothetical protein